MLRYDQFKAVESSSDYQKLHSKTNEINVYTVSTLLIKSQVFNSFVNNYKKHWFMSILCSTKQLKFICIISMKYLDKYFLISNENKFYILVFH